MFGCRKLRKTQRRLLYEHEKNLILEGGKKKEIEFSRITLILLTLKGALHEVAS
jgi:hypothetical protein